MKYPGSYIWEEDDEDEKTDSGGAVEKVSVSRRALPEEQALPPAVLDDEKSYYLRNMRVLEKHNGFFVKFMFLLALDLCLLGLASLAAAPLIFYLLLSISMIFTGYYYRLSNLSPMTTHELEFMNQLCLVKNYGGGGDARLIGKRLDFEYTIKYLK